MTDEQEQELDKLIEILKETSTIYNKKAKEFGAHVRVGYAVADYSERVEEMVEDGQEVGSNWAPDYGSGYYTYLQAPGAGGWFPSFYSEC